VDEGDADGEGETAERCLASFQGLVDDLGLEDAYQQAHTDETILFKKQQELDQLGASDKCLEDVAEAHSLEQHALALARSGDIAGAYKAYQERDLKLSTALVVARAARKFRQTVPKPEASTTTDASDAPPTASQKETSRMQPSVVAACAAIGAAVGLALLGPLGVTAGISAAVAGGVVGGAAAALDDFNNEVIVPTVEEKTRGIKEAKDKAKLKTSLRSARLQPLPE